MLFLNRQLGDLNRFCFICSKFCRTLVTKTDVMIENQIISPNQSEKRTLQNEAESETKKQKIESFVRIKRRNFAMMLGYLGKNYYGMQRNRGMRTIEEELLKAMLEAELITSEAFETIQNINFQRAARTDKGVSAIRQVVSLRLPENPCKDSINKNLPGDIRVFAIKRVTKGFNSKSQCDARTYSYTLPTFAFAEENLEQFQETAVFHDLEKRIQQLSIIDGKPCHEYRLTEDRKQKVREVLSLYEGTHNYHNFTSKVLPLDPKAKRYIMSFVAEEPFIIDDMEFITLKVKGQSFMLHQIRKMVSLAIGVTRNIISRETFDQAFELQKFDITRAPSLGLMLNTVHYDYYNKKFGADGMHESLDWAECQEEVSEFEKTKILKNVFDTELKEKSMLEFLAGLQHGSYGIREENKEENKDEIKEENELND